MIFESAPWKKRLLKLAERFEHRTHQKRYTFRTYELIEEDVFISCYIIRKLCEAGKLSQSTINYNFSVNSHPPTGKNVTKNNFHNLYELYDLDRPKPMKRNLIFLINQVIHSYVFAPVFNQKGDFDGFLVSSDHERNEALYCIEIKDYIKVLKIAGNDYPNMSYGAYCDSKKDYKIWQEMIRNITQKKAFELKAQMHLNKLSACNTFKRKT